jgi:hypothetical protein
MAKSQAYFMIVSDLRYVCWLSRMLQASSFQYLRRRGQGFSLIRLHSMNLQFDGRIGKALLRLKRVFVYIALQGRCCGR